MDPFTHLEYALFQLTPTRTRCDLLLCSGKTKEKLASGLVEPFISHLKSFKGQISKGGYSITLRPPTTNAFWFTKSTFQRLVRFINSPEVLERFIRLEREILQIENSVNDSEEQVGEAGSLSSDGSTKKSTDPSKIKTGEAGDNGQEENSKIQLQRLLETRKAMLRKEQAMAYHRALVAGFETENMNDLILFADHFGASRLREACIEFRDLCKKKHNDGLWMDELAAMAAAYPPSELAYQTSGLLIATESNASTLNNDLNFENPEGDKNADQAPSTPSNVPMQMPWPNQMPQYMYNFGPQGPRYPYPYPGMPPYYPPHMNWPVDDSGHNRHHRSSSKKKSKSPLPDSSEEEDDESNEDAESDSVSDSGTVSKHEKSSKKSKKKSSKTVVIRNINYITSNRKNSDGGGSDESAEDEVDGVLESLVKHHNKSSKSHEKKKKDADVDNESGKRNENWDAFQNLLLKDDVQDDHFSAINDALDVRSESYVKSQPKARVNDSFVVPDRNGFDESRKVNSHDFENNETFRMKGRDSSDADLVVSRGFGETGGMTSFRDLGSESSMIRNKRDGDWFVVKNSEGQTEKSTFIDDYASMKGDVFSSETNKKNVPIDDSFMVQPQTTVAYDSQWRSTDVSIIESVNKTDATESSQGAKTGFYEPDDLYLMVSRDSGTEPSVRSSWTPEIDYGTEAQFTKSEPKPAPETKEQTEESPVKAKTKKVVKPRPLSRSLPTDKRLPFVSRSVVPKSKREQEDEARRRVEELAAERQRRIAERTAAAASAKKPVNPKAVASPLKTKATAK
ncbi:COP1-interacting protein 7-like [Bidens hawaiensis]|uniref:COP1-interacting protein 7-like n=1 Tax=Bidens hawaiensis TaxID=980011 RepID=UPI004049A613